MFFSFFDILKVYSAEALSILQQQCRTAQEDHHINASAQAFAFHV